MKGQILELSNHYSLQIYNHGKQANLRFHGNPEWVFTMYHDDECKIYRTRAGVVNWSNPDSIVDDMANIPLDDFILYGSVIDDLERLSGKGRN
jgi:hypothetical protein